MNATCVPVVSPLLQSSLGKSLFPFVRTRLGANSTALDRLSILAPSRQLAWLTDRLTILDYHASSLVVPSFTRFKISEESLRTLKNVLAQAENSKMSKQESPSVIHS